MGEMADFIFDSMCDGCYPVGRAYRRTQPTYTQGDSCPKCGAAMVRRDGVHGEFAGCRAFPACKHTGKWEHTPQHLSTVVTVKYTVVLKDDRLCYGCPFLVGVDPEVGICPDYRCEALGEGMFGADPKRLDGCPLGVTDQLEIKN